MPDRYICKALDARRIDQAFPIVQTGFPQLGLDRWRRYAQEMIGSHGTGDGKVVALPMAQPSGIIVVQIGHGYIHGLFSYQVVNTLHHGRTLQVDLFVALALFDPRVTVEALLEEMDRVARQHRCDAIHLSLPKTPDAPQLARFHELGHQLEGIRLCKALPLAAE